MSAVSSDLLMPRPRVVVVFSKQRELGGVWVGDEVFAGSFGYCGLSGGVEFGFFEDFLGAGDDRAGEAGGRATWMP